jgi:hypothetical protein
LGAFEVVGTIGRSTTRSGAFDSVDLRSGAAALRGYIGTPQTWLAGLDAGFATGDEDVTDDRATGFVAAAGHRVGLIMFPYYIGWQRARTERLVAAEGIPVNALPTAGGLTDALYFHPKARYALAERFELWGGPLVAFAPGRVVDPYETTRATDGRTKNSRGGDSDRQFLGTELDVGVRARLVVRGLWLQAGVQGGVYFPGRAFAGPNSNRDSAVGAGWLRLEMRY